jgi:xanthine dehydrogenase accessory factor
VKHWQETERILHRLLGPAGEGRPAALAVVVRIEGSAYRRPGARLLIEEDDSSLGGISGGCLEEDVRLVGREVLRSGEPRLKHYDTGTDESKVWGLGLGCNGQVDVFVQRAAAEEEREPWRRVRERLEGDAPFALATVISGPGAGELRLTGEDPHETAGESGVQTAGQRQVFREVFRPPPRLLICGAGDDAIPLAATAAAVGFRVTVADHRPAYLAAERFPDARGRVHRRPEDGLAGLPSSGDAFAVVMSHSLKHDREWARRLLEAGGRYVGLLGPRARTDAILAGLAAVPRERVYGPVGLDLGAEGPEQIAVSIVAELMAVRAGRDPRHLRGKEEAVHA